MKYKLLRIPAGWRLPSDITWSENLGIPRTNPWWKIWTRGLYRFQIKHAKPLGLTASSFLSTSSVFEYHLRDNKIPPTMQNRRPNFKAPWCKNLKVTNKKKLYKGLLYHEDQQRHNQRGALEMSCLQIQLQKELQQEGVWIIQVFLPQRRYRVMLQLIVILMTLSQGVRRIF